MTAFCHCFARQVKLRLVAGAAEQNDPIVGVFRVAFFHTPQHRPRLREGCLYEKFFRDLSSRWLLCMGLFSSFHSSRANSNAPEASLRGVACGGSGDQLCERRAMKMS
ncbi:hypothetical protein [Bradyrhizobium sp. CCBAU 53415]|uniref:hypothetical protein n=1 Tax=Bradyrhizobium sp. CCBAU 53415 TaxID=1325119 RepID=UPI0023065280|nr:hypothetical protein [Bradyrhizobium sp. CCBAU 53415]